jgi:hypothetical protein
LSEAKQYEEGNHSFTFAFKLPIPDYHFIDGTYIPSGLYPSYEGKNSSIRYFVQASINISRIRGISAEIPISVSIPFDEWSSKLEWSKLETQKTVVDKEENLVDLELGNPVYCIGEPYEVKYRVNTKSRINKIRFELYHRESTNVKGYNGKHEIRLCETDIIPQEEDFREWISIVLQTDHTNILSFISSNIRCQVILKVTVERPRWNWLEITIPLLSGHCPDELKPVLTKKKPLGSARDAFQNKCPHCDAELDVGGMVRPDGTVICPKCFKRFTPEM